MPGTQEHETDTGIPRTAAKRKKKKKVLNRYGKAPRMVTYMCKDLYTHACAFSDILKAA